MFVNGSRRNERSLQRTFHRCFLPSFSSFGRGVSEEKIKMWKVNGRQMTNGKWWQKLTLLLTRRNKNRWLLFLLSWILLASLITLNSTNNLLSNYITWNHNIYMGPQVKCSRNCLPFRSTCVAFLGTVFFFLSFLLLAIAHVLSVLFDEYGIWLFMSFVSTNFSYTSYRGRRDCDHMVVGFTTICAISVLSLKLWVRTQFMANIY